MTSIIPSIFFFYKRHGYHYSELPEEATHPKYGSSAYGEVGTTRSPGRVDHYNLGGSPVKFSVGLAFEWNRMGLGY